MKNFNLYFLFIIAVLFAGCSSVSTNSSEDQTDADKSEWLIPEDQIFIGAGRDAIPAIDNPSFTTASEVTFLDDDELVIGIKVNGELKAYPHRIISYHEVVNDRIGEEPVAVTFCPLTGSALAWDRIINGEETTFGVSGFIHKNNLIAFDRLTNNNWSQMLVKSVKGSLIGKSLDTFPLIELNWKYWKSAFPNSKVLNTDTGFRRNYSFYPYGRNYSSDNDDIIFPIHEEDDRLDRKSLSHGIFYNSELQVFPLGFFSEEIQTVNRTFGGNEVVLVGSISLQLVISYSRVVNDGTVLKFTPLQEDFPIMMEDNEGNKWNVFGECVSGPRAGERLEKVPSYNAYWFAWADFFGAGPKLPIIISP